MAEGYFTKQVDYCVMDAGVTSIALVYEDGKRKSKSFDCFESEFEELFSLLNQLAPELAGLQ